jgi:hypothetical protein
MKAMGSDQTPAELREGVRSGIVSALERDAELRGGRTARLLVAAGAFGIFGALGMIRLLSGHPYGHHPSSHVVVFSAVWSGLLVVALALVFLQVRTPSLPFALAGRVGLLGLGLAGGCSVLCPDQHFLAWWTTTPVGDGLREIGGHALSALCFGGVTTLVFGAAAALAAVGSRRVAPVRPLLPAGMLLLLLLPGVALQSVGTPPGAFAGWLAGTAIGAYAGVALGVAARRRIARA